MKLYTVVVYALIFIEC